MQTRIADYVNRLAEWVGDKTQFGVRLNEASSIGEDTSHKVSLASLLPYHAYDPDTAIYLNKHSQGFILEAQPLLGASEETTQILTSVLTDVLPKNADIQFLLWGSDKVGNILDAFQKERSKRAGVYAWLAQKRIEYFKQGIHHSLLSNTHFTVRDFRLFISVSLSCKPKDDLKHDLVTLRNDMVSSFKSMHLPVRPLEVDDFISIFSDILHPSSNSVPSETQWNPYDSLSLQLTDAEHTLRVHPDKLVFQGIDASWEARLFSVKEYPKSMVQWKMMDAIGQLFNTALQIPCAFLTSLSVRLVDAEKAALNVQMKYVNKEKSAKSPIAKFMPLIVREYEDWSFVRERLSEGDRLVHVAFQILLFDQMDRAGASERKIRDLYRANGWQLKKSSYLQLQSLLSILPMMMSEGMFSDMKQLGRVRTMTAFNAANIAPLQGEWKGTRTPLLLLPGRRGQITGFSPFDNAEGNYNISIAAASGRGKSAFTQEYIVSLLGSGGRVWVIDIGRSYEKTCDILGGTFIEFSSSIDISLNPFTHTTDFDAALTMLKPLVAAMAHPTSSASDDELTFIEKALKFAWQDKRNKATITTVATWLSTQESATCQNLAHLLYSYTVDGMYGRYFEGDSNIDLSNEFVVLELQELKNKKDLQRIVMLVLMYHISGVMYLGERQQKKSCIIDEAWDLFGGDNSGAAQFIETGYRTARRFNANFITIVQSINDYFKNATTIAAYENSDNKIILGQTPETIEQLKKTERFSMDAFTERLLKSLRKTDEYSECMIKTPAGTSIHRIIFDPYSRILYSSKGQEFEQVKYLQSQGLSLSDAIGEVARRVYGH